MCLETAQPSMAFVDMGEQFIVFYRALLMVKDEMN